MHWSYVQKDPALNKLRASKCVENAHWSACLQMTWNRFNFFSPQKEHIRWYIANVRMLLVQPNHKRQTDRQITYAQLCKFRTMFTYLWVAVLGQDLQHRRFSALNISHKNQFTSHHQRLVVSPFLHYVIVIVQCFAEIYIFIYYVYIKKNRPKSVFSLWERAFRGPVLGGCPQLIWLNLPLWLYIVRRAANGSAPFHRRSPITSPLWIMLYGTS